MVGGLIPVGRFFSAAEMTDGKIQVFARLANFSSKAVTRVVSLLADDRVVASTALQLPAESVVPQVWLLAKSGAASATVLLTGGDALPEDDAAVTGLAFSPDSKT